MGDVIKRACRKVRPLSRPGRRLLRGSLIALLSGCAAMATGAAHHREGGPRLLYASSTCGVDSRVTWIDSAAGLRAVYDRIHAQDAPRADRLPPPVAFPRRAVLWLEMGRQPSAGYGLTVRPHGMEIAGATLTLHVNWLEPLPGRVYAQVITRPCLLLSVPGGDYQRVRVRDQHGALRMETAVVR